MKRSRYCKEDNWQRPAVPSWELSSGNWKFGNSVLLPRAWQLPRTSGFSYETSSDAKEAFFSTSREGGVSTWEIGHTQVTAACLCNAANSRAGQRAFRAREPSQPPAKCPVQQRSSTEIGCHGFRCRIRSALQEACHWLSFDVVSKRPVHIYLKGC